MNKTKYEKEILEDFVQFLFEDEYMITRNLVPKYVEKTLYRGEGERDLINFNLTLKKVSIKELKQKINYFVTQLSE